MFQVCRLASSGPDSEPARGIGAAHPGDRNVPKLDRQITDRLEQLLFGCRTCNGFVRTGKQHREISQPGIKKCKALLFAHPEGKKQTGQDHEYCRDTLDRPAQPGPLDIQFPDQILWPNSLDRQGIPGNRKRNSSCKASGYPGSKGRLSVREAPHYAAIASIPHNKCPGEQIGNPGSHQGIQTVGRPNKPDCMACSIPHPVAHCQHPGIRPAGEDILAQKTVAVSVDCRKPYFWSNGHHFLGAGRPENGLAIRRLDVKGIKSGVEGHEPFKSLDRSCIRVNQVRMAAQQLFRGKLQVPKRGAQTAGEGFRIIFPHFRSEAGDIFPDGRPLHNLYPGHPAGEDKGRKSQKQLLPEKGGETQPLFFQFLADRARITQGFIGQHPGPAGGCERSESGITKQGCIPPPRPVCRMQNTLFANYPAGTRRRQTCQISAILENGSRKSVIFLSLINFLV